MPERTGFASGAPSWVDLGALTARVRDGGGTPHIEPMDVGDAGRLAFFVHPAAGAFGAWQAGTSTGAELIREPYSFSWAQLMARDVAAARAFLTAALGVETAEEDFGGEEPYVLLVAGGEPVAGIAPMPDEMPAEVPPFWDVAFEVADVDATLEKAEQLGATVTMQAMDMPGVGRFGGVRDPQGATFTVMVSEPA